MNWKAFNLVSFFVVFLVTYYSARAFFESLNGVVCLLPIMVMLASALIRIAITRKD